MPAEQPPVGVDIIFCGNPGVGKSTLLSSISNCRFESGLSYGGGLTCELQWQTNEKSWPGYRFADTPGLADIALAEKASQAITQALQDAAMKGRTVKIYFVVTCESGRVRPDDYITITKVMDSMKLADGTRPDMNQYAVIINKCGEGMLNNDKFQKQGKKAIELTFAEGKLTRYTTSQVSFFPEAPAAKDTDNAKIMCQSLLGGILMFPGIDSLKEADSIDVRNFQQQLLDQKVFQKRAMDELEKRLTDAHAAQLKLMQETVDKQKDDLLERVRVAERKRKAAGGGVISTVLDIAMLVGKPIYNVMDLYIDKNDEEGWERRYEEFLGNLKEKIGYI